MAGTIVRRNNTRLFIWDKGSTVSKSDKIANIVSIGDIAVEAEEIDVTTIDNLSREFEIGFTDNGSLDVVLSIVENEFSYAKARLDNADDIEWGISVFNKKGEQILGLHGYGVTKSSGLTGISVGGWLQCNMSIRVSGDTDNTFVDPIGGSVVDIPVTEITVNTVGGGTATIDTAGGTLQLVAAIKPENAQDKRVTWSVDDNSKATISTTGMITAKANGTVVAKATAKDGSGISGEKSITITNQT